MIASHYRFSKPQLPVDHEVLRSILKQQTRSLSRFQAAFRLW